MGVEPKIVGKKKQNGWCMMENPIKHGMIWGYFYFWKHPYEHITKTPMDLSANRFQEMSFSFLNEVDEYFTNVNFQEKTQGSLNTLPMQKQLDLKTFNQMCPKQSRKKNTIVLKQSMFLGVLSTLQSAVSIQQNIIFGKLLQRFLRTTEPQIPRSGNTW